MSLLLQKFLRWVAVCMNNISVTINIIIIVSSVTLLVVTLNENTYCDAAVTATSSTHPSRFGTNNNFLYKKRVNMIRKTNRSINNDDFFSSSTITTTTTKTTKNSSTTMAKTKGSCCQRVGRGGSTKRSNLPKTNENYHSIADDNNNSSNHHYHRRACSLYIWNAPSALLYKWCCHLQRDNIYEGRGGRKFVRIQPGSMLQLLYPCTRYSVDKCLLCGGTFHDHLFLWWSKHLYTPFDRYLDRVRSDGEVVTTASALTNTAAGQHTTTITNNNKRRFNRVTNPTHQNIDHPQYDYRYHHRYVLDITTLLKAAKKQTPCEKKELILRAVTERYQTMVPNIKLEHMEQRSWRPYFTQPAIQYVVPNYDESNSGISNAFSESKAILQMARFACLNAIDRLLDIQYLDSRRTKKKQL